MHLGGLLSHLWLGYTNNLFGILHCSLISVEGTAGGLELLRPVLRLGRVGCDLHDIMLHCIIYVICSNDLVGECEHRRPAPGLELLI